MKLYGGGGHRISTENDKPPVPRPKNVQTTQELDRRFLFEDDIDALLTDTLDTPPAPPTPQPAPAPADEPPAVAAATEPTVVSVPEETLPENKDVNAEPLPGKKATDDTLTFPSASTENDTPQTVQKPLSPPSVSPAKPSEPAPIQAAASVKPTRVGHIDPAAHRANPPAPRPVIQNEAGENLYRLIDDEDVVYTAPVDFSPVSRPSFHSASAIPSRTPYRVPASEPVIPHKRRWPWVVSGVAAFCVFMYCFVCFFPTPFVRKWRNIWIETAMSTMTHQWLATAFFPESLINDILISRYELEEAQKDMSADKSLVSSTSAANLGTLRSNDDTPSSPDNLSSGIADGNSSAQITNTTAEDISQWLNPNHPLYLAYPEIDMESFCEYALTHEDDMFDEDGYLVIDEADRSSKGTCIKTTNGDTVKVLDTRNGIIIASVSGDGFKGLIAIIRDPAQVGLVVSSKFGTSGQRIPTICKNSNAILGINASGFEDPDGTGNGGNAYGYVLSKGKQYSSPERSDWFIMGFDEDNIFNVYSTSKFSTKSNNFRDAMEFQPLLVNNGKIVCTENDGYGINPRAALGQCADGSVLMIVIDGRTASSLGCRGLDLAQIFYDYHAVQAANVDGGSSAVMYYNGRVISNPSGQNKTEGRLLPDAWVVYKAG